MTKLARISVCVGLLVAVAFFTQGCSTVSFYTSSPEELAQELMGPPGKLKKQVIIARFYNPSQAQDLNLEELLANPAKARLKKKCGRVFIQDSPRMEYLAADHFGPITGVRRNLELLAEVRTTGAGVLVTGSLWKVVVEREKRGIYPFREFVNVLKVSLDLWVYDSLTGAKIKDKRIYSELELKDGDSLETVQWKEKIFPEFVEEVEEIVCKSLKELPWSGFVTDVSGNMVTIASGKEVGLRKGMLLWVCADGEVVEGLNNEKFVVPGKRLARAKIVEVNDSSCVAELVENSDIQKATWVSIRNRRDRINPM